MIILHGGESIWTKLQEPMGDCLSVTDRGTAYVDQLHK